MRLSNTLSNCTLKTPGVGVSTTSLGRFSHWMIGFAVKIPFLYHDKSSPNTSCIYSPVSSPGVSLWKDSLCPLCSCPLRTETPWMRSASRPSLLQGKNHIISSLSSHRTDSPTIFKSLLWTFSFWCISWILGIITGHSSPGVAWQVLSAVGCSCLYFCQECPCVYSPGSNMSLLLQQLTAGIFVL